MIPEKLISIFRNASSIAVLTGAGISAESGVPTFRDAQTGFWAQFNPEDLATPQAFRRNPKMVWEWYDFRRGLIRNMNPNVGHYALVEIQKRVASFALITQNVDDLHARAGSEHILELHGNITRTKCFVENTPVSSWKDDGNVPPRCPNCGGLLRPDVVWFGEDLPRSEMLKAMEAAQTCDVFMSIGTSGVVYPAAGLPFTALQSGATVVDINPEETPLSAKAHFSIRGKSGEILPDLVRRAWG